MRAIITRMCGRLPIYILLLLSLVSSSLEYRYHKDSWNYMSVRYGLWYTPPLTSEQAIRLNYNRKNSNCKTTKHIGFLFHRHGDKIVMPIYDSNGILAGIQSAIPGNMLGYNSFNETIPLPPSEVKPPFLHAWTNSRGVRFYTLTAYFKHPRRICNRNENGVEQGKGLYLQTGVDAEINFIKIPLQSKNLDSAWTKTICMADLGTRYFKDLNRNLLCEKLYPLFIVYDGQGELGAFGWSFQGSPTHSNRHSLKWFRLYPSIYPFLFGTLPLPACMHNEKFRVSGIHIWLKPKEEMTCSPRGHTPSIQHKTPEPAEPPGDTITRFAKQKRKIPREESEDKNRYTIDTSGRSNKAPIGAYIPRSVIFICVILSTFVSVPHQ